MIPPATAFYFLVKGINFKNVLAYAKKNDDIDTLADIILGSEAKTAILTAAIESIEPLWKRNIDNALYEYATQDKDNFSDFLRGQK